MDFVLSFKHMVYSAPCYDLPFVFWNNEEQPLRVEILCQFAREEAPQNIAGKASIVSDHNEFL